jgi:hypothetical protein
MRPIITHLRKLALPVNSVTAPQTNAWNTVEERRFSAA